MSLQRYTSWGLEKLRQRMQDNQGDTPENSDFVMAITTIKELLKEVEAEDCFLKVHSENGDVEFVQAGGAILWMSRAEANDTAQKIIQRDASLKVEIVHLEEESTWIM